MVDASKIRKIKWHTFHISIPSEIHFMDCWVEYYNETVYHFRYYPSPPRGAPYQILRLGYPYNYLKGFGESGELPYEFYSEFVYQCNNWYQYALLNFNSNKNGKDKSNINEGSQGVRADA